MRMYWAHGRIVPLEFLGNLVSLRHEALDRLFVIVGCGNLGVAVGFGRRPSPGHG